MRIPGVALAVALLLATVVAGSRAPASALAPDGWHPDLESGVKAAKVSGKAVLVVTLWANDQCETCKAWRKEVQTDPAFKSVANRFERVEWLYGALAGKVIPWTQANGGHLDDPKVQVFVAGTDGKVIARAPDADVMVPKELVLFLKGRADEWDRDHPRTKVPFLPAKVEGSGEGAARKVLCRALDDAKEQKSPVAIYVWRQGLPLEVGKEKAESEACRRWEKETLANAEAAKAADGWTLLVLDRTDPDHALLAKDLGVEAAPTVVLIVPGEPKPIVLDKTISGGGLALQFAKYGTAKKK